MTEFTEEQEKEILLRVQKAQNESRLQQQWVIAGDQFYRESITNLSVKVQQGLYDKYILDVGKVLYNAFRKTNLPQSEEIPVDEVKQE